MKNPLLNNGIKETLNGVMAGILIAIGGSVFLACDSKVVGAILFSVALLCICYKGYNLYTGKIGFMPYDKSIKAFSTLFSGLLGNAIATIVLGFAISYAVSGLEDKAYLICTAKLNQEFFQTLIRAIFCGILMYLAVSVYREHKTPIAIVFCIPVFILSGFEHSIANMFYFATSGIASFDAFGYIWICILGNTIGAMILPLISIAIKKMESKDEQN